MNLKKNYLMRMPANSSTGASSSNTGGLNLPNIDVRVMGSALEVVLITGLNCQFMFSDIIRMLHEEGAEVVSASFSVLDHTVFHTIHSKVEANSTHASIAAVFSFLF